MTFQIPLAFDRWYTEDPSRFGVDVSEEVKLRKVYVDLLADRGVTNFSLKRISERATFIPRFIEKGAPISFEDVRKGAFTSGRHYTVHIFFEDEDQMLMAQYVLMKDYIS